MEVTAVLPEGRISPEDAGLWADSQIAPLKRIVDFVHTQATKIGVQLGHAGRKASTLSPWVQLSVDGTHRANTAIAFANEGGWPGNGMAPILGLGFRFDIFCFQFMRLSLFPGPTGTLCLRR